MPLRSDDFFFFFPLKEVINATKEQWLLKQQPDNFPEFTIFKAANPAPSFAVRSFILHQRRRILCNVHCILLYFTAAMGGRCCLQVLLAVREDIQLFQPQASLQTLRCAVLRPLLRQAVAVGHTSVRSAEALLAYQRSFSHSGNA